MPVADLAQTIRAAVQKNKEIPAVLDAYGEFVDSQIGPLELSHLDEIFSRILDNLMQRFPEIASKRAANTAKNDILSFLILGGKDPERVKLSLRSELNTIGKTMAESIAERFTRMSSEERSAIDATLRLIRRSSTDILFRADVGKQLSTSGQDYERFFAAVRSESSTMRELRYENLIVEKGVFNKLLMKTAGKDYFIWVPSLYARDNADFLIERAAIPNGHLLISRLKDLKIEGLLGTEDSPNNLRSFLSALLENGGVMPKTSSVPSELAGFLNKQDRYLVMSPLDLDDVASFIREEEEAKAAALEAEEEENRRIEAETRLREEERKAEQARLRRKLGPQMPQAASPALQQSSMRSSQNTGKDSIFMGRELDREQLLNSIAKRVQEKELGAQVKTIGDYFLESDEIVSRGLVITGSSGSGRSTTLRRVLDGLGAKTQNEMTPNLPHLFVIDQKGEHRGLAWKFKWQVLAFAADSQAQEFKVPVVVSKDDSDSSSALIGYLLQEWCLEAGLSCTDQQAERIASIVRTLQHSAEPSTSPFLDSVVEALTKEPELALFGQKISKSLIGKGYASRIFSSDQSSMKLEAGRSCLFDISGRGLRDPTTREERQLISVLILREMVKRGVAGSIIVLEDVLDRFKSDGLKRIASEMTSELMSRKNAFVVTSRTQVRDFVGPDSMEILHRLSGEKAVSEEIAGFKTDLSSKTIASVVGFLPRGYAITSRTPSQSFSSALRVEPLQFGT